MLLAFCRCSVIYHKVYVFQSGKVNVAIYLSVIGFCVDDGCKIDACCFFHAFKNLSHNHRHISGNLVYTVRAAFASTDDGNLVDLSQRFCNLFGDLGPGS